MVWPWNHFRKASGVAHIYLWRSKCILLSFLRFLVNQESELFEHDIRLRFCTLARCVIIIRLGELGWHATVTVENHFCDHLFLQIRSHRSCFLHMFCILFPANLHLVWGALPTSGSFQNTVIRQLDFTNIFPNVFCTHAQLWSDFEFFLQSPGTRPPHDFTQL